MRKKKITVSNGNRMRSKLELISALDDLKIIANKRDHKKLFMIENASDVCNACGPIFSTAPKGSKYRNKIVLGVYDSNPSEIDFDKRNVTYVSLGKSRAFPDRGIYFSFAGDDFKGEEEYQPRSPSEIYDFLETFVMRESERSSIINRFILDMENEFYKRLEAALEFQRKSQDN
jgi:hypothetical protein